MNITAGCIDAALVKQGYTLMYKKFFSQVPKFIQFLYTSFPEYLGTVTDRAIITDYSDLMNYDAFVIMSEAHLKPNGQVIFNAMLGHPFRHIAECLDIPTLFVGTRDVDTIEKYGKYRFKFPYYIVSHRDSIMGVLTEINLKKDAEVFLIAVDKHHHDTKHTNLVLKQVEKELKLYAREID